MADGIDLTDVPKFEDLPAVDGTERHSWDVFGRDDEVGTVNFIGPEQVRAAAALVTTGELVGLGLPLTDAGPEPLDHAQALRASLPDRQPRPGRLARRLLPAVLQPVGRATARALPQVRLLRRAAGRRRREQRRHRHPQSGRAGAWSAGASCSTSRATSRRQAASWCRTSGTASRRRNWTRIAECGRRTACAQGDIVVVRTGWVEWYMSLPPERRAQLVGTVGAAERPLACPGLDSGGRPPRGYGTTGAPRSPPTISRSRRCRSSATWGSCTTGCFPCSACRSVSCGGSRTSPPIARGEARTNSCSPPVSWTFRAAREVPSMPTRSSDRGPRAAYSAGGHTKYELGNGE